MGYYSDFEVDGTDIPFIKDVLDNATHPDTWDEWQERVTMSSTKWYDWLIDLNKVAKLYPDNYLIILRHGEEGGDISRVVVKDGKAIEQWPKLIWPKA